MVLDCRDGIPLLLWYATAAVVLDCRGGIPFLLWCSATEVVFHFCSTAGALGVVLASVTTFVLKPLLFPETLSLSMPTFENEISFRFFVSVFFRPPRTRAGADLSGNLVLYAIFVL